MQKSRSNNVSQTRRNDCVTKLTW